MSSTTYDMISMDLGRNGALAIWKDNICVDIRSWSFKNTYVIQDLTKVWNIWVDIIMDNRPIVSVESPSRQMPIQWILYSDLRKMCISFNLEFNGYKPPMIKKTVTGYGRADKDDMKASVLEGEWLTEGLMPKDEHEFDAVGCGICYLKKNGMVK
mgnify:CR=1 FL=1